MTADATRPPILLIRAEGTLGRNVELHLLDPDGDTRLIACRDGLDSGEDLETLVRVAAMAQTHFQDVIVDLERVKWLDSTGLGWLVGLARQRKQQDDAVALAGVNERIAKLLEVTSLNLALPSHPTVAAAAASLRAPASGS
jgi:anti-anti-sigma factor